MKNSIRTSLLLVAGLLACTLTSGVASATTVLDQNQTLSGTTFAVDDPSLASFINANTTNRVRWTAQESLGSATTTDLTADPAYTSSDHYWTLNTAALVSGGSAIPTSANFVQLDFTLSGGWVLGDRTDQLFRNTDTSSGSGSTTLTNPELLPWTTTAGDPIADGSYSVIFELTAPDAGATWANLRYDFFNEQDANNPPHPNAGGKTYTLNAVTFGSAVAVIPEPSSLALLAIAGVGMVARRRKQTA